MRYLEQRNQRLSPQFKTIARYYKAHGERYRVRWDYAFFQMLLETGFLTYKGDVKPTQNNFAGLGATGGGGGGAGGTRSRAYENCGQFVGNWLRSSPIGDDDPLCLTVGGARSRGASPSRWRCA